MTEKTRKKPIKFEEKSLVEQEISIARQCAARLAKLPPSSQVSVKDMLDRMVSAERKKLENAGESTEASFG